MASWLRIHLLPVAIAAPLAACAGQLDVDIESPVPAGAPSAEALRVAPPTFALAEFEGSVDPETGVFRIESVIPGDVAGQAQAFSEAHGIRTVEQASVCTGRVVTDGTPGTNPPDSFEIYTLPGSIAGALPGGVIPSQCLAGNTSLYSVDGVFCATVRVKNFYAHAWNNVHVHLSNFTGTADQRPYEHPFGTGATLRDPLGNYLPTFSNVPVPGDEYGVWSYGDLAASGGESTVTWTFRNGTTTYWTFRGRVFGQLAENCATPAVDEDCDGDPLNACRLYETGEACAQDADCVSFLCISGECAPGCAPGLYGAACENECTGGAADPCSGNGDCSGGRDGDGSCACDPGFYGVACDATCEDGVQNGNETGVDVGGDCAPVDCNGLWDPENDGVDCTAAEQFAMGAWHSCFLLEDGTIRCAGNHVSGRLGLGAVSTSVAYGQQVGSATDWAQISLGDDHTCAVNDAGALFCWGLNTSGRLGDGSTTTRTAPVQIFASGVDSIHAGGEFTCALRSGERWCWGSNTSAALGNGTTTSGSNATPTRYDVYTDWQRLSLGRTHGCGIRGEGELWCWGYNGMGQGGNGTTPSSNHTPTRIGSRSDWVHISAGYNFNCGITADDALWCWGLGSNGQHGHGSTSNVTAPTRVMGASGSTWQSVDTGTGAFACGVQTDGTMWCWGANSAYQLGQEVASTTVSSPLQMGTDTDWVEVVAGEASACGRRTNGSIWCWGEPGFGRNATGYPTANVSVPHRSQDVAPRWESVSHGLNLGCGITLDGQLWCWSLNNAYGVLGQGNTTTSYWPRRVGTESDWIQVDVGFEHVCGLRSGGRLFCWGRNHRGQAGQNPPSTAHVTTPLEIAPFGVWSRVATTQNATCAVHAVEQQVYCWGDRLYGMLGDNFAASAGRSLPGPVTSPPGFVDVQAGEFHFCAIRGPSPGTLHCWGRNSDSQIGNGSSADALTPVSVLAGSLTWRSVTAGERHTCGVTNANELWCWGSGAARANGFTFTQPTPARVGVESDWTFVAAGNTHTCGIRAPGSLWCFGTATSGALGTGSTTNTPVPGQVGTRTDWEFVATGNANTTGIRGGVRYIWGVNPDSYLGTGVRWPGPVPSLASQPN